MIIALSFRRKPGNRQQDQGIERVPGNHSDDDDRKKPNEPGFRIIHVATRNEMRSLKRIIMRTAGRPIARIRTAFPNPRTRSQAKDVEI